MRNRRQVKKLSKKLAPYFPEAWLGDGTNNCTVNSQETTCKGIYCIGGELDYWGEGGDFLPLIYHSEKMLFDSHFCAECCIGEPHTDCPLKEYRNKPKAKFNEIRDFVAYGRWR